MKLSFTSDTHGKHRKLTDELAAERPDVLCHCGDFTNTGTMDEIRAFADWCAMLLAKGYTKHIVVIAGNHELGLDETHPQCRAWGIPESVVAVNEAFLEDAGVKYLRDSGCEIEVPDDGPLRFYGIPWTMKFYDWAFQICGAEQDAEIVRKAFKIMNPEHDAEIAGRAGREGIDVLLTHGPPMGIRDTIDGRGPLGSAWQAQLRARIHAFGHLHKTRGITLGARTLYINAAFCDDENRGTGRLWTVEL